ncbi:MAG: hypothetical protein J6A69_01905 [Clostridia bacterium]|nr:hypothetical protein [Clostridia bacterium]
MWTEILVTNDLQRTELLKDLLNKNSILCRIKRKNDNGVTTCAVLVPSAEVDFSLELMIDNNLN